MKANPHPQPTDPSPGAGAEALSPEERMAIKRRLLHQRLRQVDAWASRMVLLPDGRRMFLRFTPAHRIEHMVHLVAFVLLAVTGLLQRFSYLSWVAYVASLLGGLEKLRAVHRVAAIALALTSVYHAWEILETWFVRREKGPMWPQWQDFQDLWQNVKYNLGLASRRPQYDRFSIEEKMEYWALLWGTLLMGVTGLMMWWAEAITRLLPGWLIPVARALHGWEAVLAVLAILTWHMYHVLVKTRNTSIFTGYMTEEEMKHEHPREYRRILKAYALRQKIWRELLHLAEEEEALRQRRAQERARAQITPG